MLQSIGIARYLPIKPSIYLVILHSLFVSSFIIYLFKSHSKAHKLFPGQISKVALVGAQDNQTKGGIAPFPGKRFR